MFPASLRGFALPSNSPFDPFNENSSNGEFYLHPHYRAERPLDKTLLKVQAGLDSFVSEKYYDQIALILAEWSLGLRAISTANAGDRESFLCRLRRVIDDSG